MYGNKGAVINNFSSKLKLPSRIRSLCSRYLKLSGPAKLSTPEKIEKMYLTKTERRKTSANPLGVIFFIPLSISYF